MRIVSACLIAIACLFVFPHLLFAQSVDKLPEVTEGQINESLARIVPIRYDPSQPLYPLIRIKEPINRFFKPSAAERAKFDLVLSGKRLKEVYMLLDKGDVKNASKTMSRYGERLAKMSQQLEKARSQNQEVSGVVGEIADGLRTQEVLLYAVDQKAGDTEDAGFSANFTESLAQFRNAVVAIDAVQPGLRNRFLSITPKEEEIEATPSPTPTTGSGYFEASPSNKPRRIIY